MAKFNIKLKQHTPLIHFQAEQPGAILRATEVKPKLDRFLIEYVFNNEFEKYKQYLIGYKDGKTEEDFKNKKAFNYKLRITNVKNRQEKDIENKSNYKTISFPNYFGNMDDNDIKHIGKKNRFVFCDSLDLEMFSFEENLLVKIAEKLPLFLMTHNFGQRQSKGFGSFFINDENKYFINKKEYFYDQNEVDSLKKATYSFVFHKCINKSIEKQINNREEFYKEAFAVFDQIEKLYTKMRSGGQKGNSYIKEFFKSKNIIWDKDAIRNSFVNDRKDIPKNAYLVKDLLGLSVDEKWKDKKDFNVKKEYKGKEKYNEDKIERMESPILFKPIKDKKGEIMIYVIIKTIPKEFFNKTFTIMKCVKEKNKKNTTVVKKIKLTTPKKNDFNVDEFWKFVECKEKNNKNRRNNNDKVKKFSSLSSKQLDKLENLKKMLVKNQGGEVID